MEKFATPDEVLAQIRRMSIQDREYVDADESGRATEPGEPGEPGQPGQPAAVMDEIIRRASESLAHPDDGVSREEAVASARLAVQRARLRRS
jgi:hypothetical protein